MIKVKKVTKLSNLSTLERDSIRKINDENLTRNGGTLSLSNILQYYAQGDIVLLAYKEDEVVGYALIKKPMNEGIDFMKSCAGEIRNNGLNWSKIVANPNALYVAQIAIARNHQGCGVATAMMESMNKSVVISNAKVQNTGSHKMHIKNGFKVIGGMFSPDDEPYDVLYYRDVRKCV